MKNYTVPKVYYARIYLHRTDIVSGSPEMLMEWKGMLFDHFIRWEWFFRYRAALLQVEHGKRCVELRTGNYEAKDHDLDYYNFNKKRNRITTCKRMINKIQNALDKHAETEKEKLVPYIDEDPRRQRTLIKLQEYQDELKQLLEN